MKTTIKPIADRILVIADAVENTTKSGIYIPDIAKEKPITGQVVAVGKGKNGESMEVNVGDKVLYGKYSGTEIKYEDQDYLIMRESDIYAIL